MPASAGSTIVAKRYAGALFDVVLDKEVDADKVGDELASASSLLDAQPKLAEALSTPAIPIEKRVAVFEAVFSRQDAAACTKSLLRLLTERERIPMLPLIVEQYRLMVQEHKKVQPGRVTSAHPLSPDQQQRLAGSLGDALARTMELSFSVDPELVGGIVVRVGNRVYDASVVTQLQRFKEKALSSL